MGWNKLTVSQQREGPTVDDVVLQRGVMGSVAIIIAMSSFLLGIMYERRTNPANSVELESFWQVWEIIEDDYYGELPDADVRKYGAVNGLLSTLNDQYTTFAPPEQAEAQRQQIDGHFGGIGVTIDVIEGDVTIVMVIPQNPAAKAGLQPGDVFDQVDGRSARGWTMEMLAGQVRGEVGTQVDLRMYRPSEDRYFNVEIARAIIEIPTVYSRQLEEGIGVIELRSFNGVATDQMEIQLEELINNGVWAIVLDLRSNGGGLLDQAVKISDLFLGEGVVLTQRSNDGEEEVFRSVDGQLGEEIPLVVLADNFTASASEVVAGALQDRDRAVIIGQNTFGKGVVQNVYNLTDNSQLRITAAAWFTPNGRAINGQGLDPDVVINVPLSVDSEQREPFLEAAVNYLEQKYPEHAKADAEE